MEVISATILLNLFITAIIVFVVAYLVVWLIGKAPIPAAIKNVLIFAAYAIAVVFIIMELLRLM
jgi:branched-subunit amino acid transport protein